MRRITPATFFVGAALIVVGLPQLSAQPVGSEFQVNTYTTSFQYRPAVSSDADGDFVVVWRSYRQDGSSSGIFSQRYQAPSSGVAVEIDIKPGSAQNPIDPKSKDVIPVAILTTATFDAWDVDSSTLAFGRGGVGIKHATGHAEDVDKDGDLDMILHFKAPAGVVCGDTEATLTGETFGGVPIEGTDVIKDTGV